MKALIQRVSQGRVDIDGATVSAIGRGYVVLLGVREGDDPAAARQLATKTLNLRIFPDPQEKMNLALRDVDGQVLVISQFTLYADTRKGNRPSFLRAGPPETARQLYEDYVAALRAGLGPDNVQTGRFGASMSVSLVNEGPVTIELSTDTI